MAALIPTAPGVAHQPQIRLVDQGRRIERVAGSLVGHCCAAEPPQLVVDQRQQLAAGLSIALVDRLEQPRDVGHADHDNSCGSSGRSISWRREHARRCGEPVRNGTLPPAHSRVDCEST